MKFINQVDADEHLSNKMMMSFTNQNENTMPI